jgi:hypothetical protein
MTDEWVEVSNCAWVHQALFVKSVLDAAGIEAVVPDEHTANLQSLYVPALGGVRVMVRVSDQDAAREVLASAQPEEPATAERLQQLATHLANQKGSVVALFAGPDRAAIGDAVSTVAEQSSRSVIRIDLGDVRSKYIGETEKHLNAVFAEAARSSAILFFHEADALFGRGGDDAGASGARLLEHVLRQKENGRVWIILSVADACIVPARARERIDYVLAFGS